MKYRKLRIAWSVAWGVVAVLLCLLWVRSHYYYDLGTSGIVPIRGSLYMTQKIAMQPRYTSTARFVRTMLGTQAVPAADFVVEPLDAFTIPFWFLVLVTGAASRAPWFRWPTHFSLRTLLIATTLVAVALGLIVWATK
jgi:hypothetical protein